MGVKKYKVKCTQCNIECEYHSADFNKELPITSSGVKPPKQIGVYCANCKHPNYI